MLPLPPNAEQAGKQEREREREREGERGLPSAQAPEQSKGRERERERGDGERGACDAFRLFQVAAVRAEPVDSALRWTYYAAAVASR